jgi:hypothetical protein
MYAESADAPPAGDRDDGNGEDFGIDTEIDLDVDLEEAGADWLSEQGFDRKDRFSGDY